MSSLLKTKQQELEAAYVKATKNTQIQLFPVIQKYIKNNADLLTHAYNEDHTGIYTALNSGASPNAFGGLAMKILNNNGYNLDKKDLLLVSDDTIVESIPYLYDNTEMKYVDMLLSRVKTHTKVIERIDELFIMSFPENEILSTHLLKKYVLGYKSYVYAIKTCPNKMDLVSYCVAKTDGNNEILHAIIDSCHDPAVFQCIYAFGYTYDYVSTYLFRYATIDQISLAIKRGHNIYNLPREIFSAAIKNKDIEVTKFTALLFGDYTSAEMDELILTGNVDKIRFVLDNLSTGMRCLSFDIGLRICYLNDEYVLTKMKSMLTDHHMGKLYKLFGENNDNVIAYKVLFGSDSFYRNKVWENVAKYCPKILRHILGNVDDLRKIQWNFNLGKILSSMKTECIEILYTHGLINIDDYKVQSLEKIFDERTVDTIRLFIKMGYKFIVDDEGFAFNGDTWKAPSYIENTSDDYVIELLSYGILIVDYHRNNELHVDTYVRLASMIPFEYMRYFVKYPGAVTHINNARMVKNKDDMICQE